MHHDRINYSGNLIEEIKNVKQLEGEPHRRWFKNHFMELIIWSESDEIVGFQLCYDVGWNERAITWMKESGFEHSRVDDGEGHCSVLKGTPILVPGGIFGKEIVLTEFTKTSTNMPAKIREFVLEKLELANL